MTDYTYNTGNPIGSTDVRDGVDNLKSFDVLLNSTDVSYQDRLGNTVPTAAGAIKALGPVVTAWTFTTGGTLNYPNEAALNPVDGNYYGWTGAFQKVVAPGTDPTLPGSGYVPRTDVVLRNELYSRLIKDVGEIQSLTDHPSAKDYGVYGDGITNDTAAINAGNSIIRRLPGGYYKYDQNTGAAEWFARNLVTDDDVRFSGTGVFGGCVNFKSSFRYPKVSSLANIIRSGTAITIDCHGDSIMWGAKVGDLLNKNTVNPPEQLAAALFLVFGFSFTVNNKAIGGTMLRQMLQGNDGSGKTFGYWMDNSSASVVMCNHCTNDFQEQTDIAQYKTDLETFVCTVRSRGKIPVLVTPPSYTMSKFGTQAKASRSSAYIDAMRDVARDLDCDLIDQHKMFKDSERGGVNVDLLIGDGVHPTTIGYRQYGYNLAIPFVGCASLGDECDFAGLTNTDIFCNFASKVFSPWKSRTGEALIVTRESGKSIVFPVILTKPSASLSILGAKVSNGAIVNAGANGESLSTVQQFRYYGAGDINDADFEIPCNLLCGLNLIVITFSTLETSATKNAFVFCGVRIPKADSSTLLSYETKLKAQQLMGVNRSIVVTSAGKLSTHSIAIMDTAGNLVQSIRWNAGTVTTSLYADNVEVEILTISTSQPDEQFTFLIEWLSGSIKVTTNGTTVTHNTGLNTPQQAGLIGAQTNTHSKYR